KGQTVSGGNPLTADLNLSGGTTFLCGDQVLMKDIQIITPRCTSTSNCSDPQTLVIENGSLDLNGFHLTMGTDSAVAIVFSGDNKPGFTHAPTELVNGGTETGLLELTAPYTGLFAGVALYQDPSLTSGVDVVYKGNDPTWRISGLAYFPMAT